MNSFPDTSCRNIYYKLGAGITKAAAEEAAQQSPYLQHSRGRSREKERFSR